MRLEREYGVGARVSRRCRASGARRVLYTPGSQSEDEGWFVVCQPHAYCLQTETRRLGEAAIADPYWCEDCATLMTSKEYVAS